MESYYFLLVLGIVLMIIAVALLLRPVRAVPAAIPAYLALVTLHFSLYIMLPGRTFLFWGFATLLAVMITWALPAGEPDGHRSGNVYIGVGAIMGALLGIIVSARIMLLGVVLGTFLGQMAYSRTPHGAWMKFPAKSFAQYFLAKGLAAIVTVGMLGIAVEGFIF